ncbi:hypothetical protein K488DRAFT_82434 [Vararia minispora EC-137]|uniref:Uncharacterized protein n=1 Tax=Vararia minispora EC-137 TaxID=1314806 RepID=A0ACB8QW19_9AGAM|nr:hypothetical protein K488DRAFT_82434 [Vararia minispora EC-137]
MSANDVPVHPVTPPQSSSHISDRLADIQATPLNIGSSGQVSSGGFSDYANLPMALSTTSAPRHETSTSTPSFPTG